MCRRCLEIDLGSLFSICLVGVHWTMYTVGNVMHTSGQHTEGCMDHCTFWKCLIWSVVEVVGWKMHICHGVRGEKCPAGLAACRLGLATGEEFSEPLRVHRWCVRGGISTCCTCWFVPTSGGFHQPYPHLHVSLIAEQSQLTLIDMDTHALSSVHKCCLNNQDIQKMDVLTFGLDDLSVISTLYDSMKRRTSISLLFIGSFWEAFWPSFCIFYSWTENFLTLLLISKSPHICSFHPVLDSQLPHGPSLEVISEAGDKQKSLCSSCSVCFGHHSRKKM